MKPASLLLLCLLCGCGESTAMKQHKEICAKYDKLVELTATNCFQKGFLFGARWERACASGEFTNNAQAAAAWDFALTNYLATRPGR